MNKLNFPKAVIIDFDNTLVQTNKFFKDHLKEVCKRMDIEYPGDKEITEVLKLNLDFDAQLEHLFGSDGPGVLEDYRKDASEKPYSPTLGGLEFITNLNEKGVDIIIMTNRLKILELRLKQAGYYEKWFLGFVTPAEGKRKPDKEAYLPAIGLLKERGFTFKDIAVIGDHPNDFEAIPEDNEKKKLMIFYAVLSGTSTKQDFIKLGLSENNIFKNLTKIGLLNQ
jgi:beta-phosphoglucomutase-like phosphatase (HAD superfamily)